MATTDLLRLTDDEKSELAALLKRAIDVDRYPFSPRIRALKGILAKLHANEDAILRRQSNNRLEA